MSRQNLARKVFLLFCPFFLFIIGNSSYQSEIYQAPVQAPINEQYLSFSQNLSLYSRTNRADDGHSLGLIPSIIDRSYLKNSIFMSSQLLPTAYDLRNQNRLTAVRDQKNCGSCWAFACFGSLESTLMPLEKKDYSEQHLISEHLYDWNLCYGGNIDIATAYLSRWSGPMKESDFPYPYFFNLPLNENALSVKKHIQNVIYLPPRLNSMDNDQIKNAVINYGGIYTTMYFNTSFYNSINKSYYNLNNKSGSHAVVIVGWDDYYDRSKFTYTPPGNGAFIVRNSWGTYWGDEGYFYVSYYDAYLGREDVNAAVTADPVTAYSEIYQYDPLGWTTSFGYRSNTAWFANIFVSRSSLPLNAVSFYCAGTTNYYEIYIYVNPVVNKPKSGTLVAAKTGEISTPGYYTICLANPISLNPNQRFSVVVRLQTQNYDYPIPAEYRFNGYSSRASANSNESFVSNDGNSWYDIHTSWDGMYANTNVCLKAFAGYLAVYPPSNLSLERLTNDFIFFIEHINRLSWEPNSKNKYSIVKYRIYKKNIDADETEFRLLAEILSDNTRFEIRGLRKDERCCYGISSIDELGRESDIVEINN